MPAPFFFGMSVSLRVSYITQLDGLSIVAQSLRDVEFVNESNSVCG